MLIKNQYSVFGTLRMLNNLMNLISPLKLDAKLLFCYSSAQVVDRPNVS